MGSTIYYRTNKRSACEMRGRFGEGVGAVDATEEQRTAPKRLTNPTTVGFAVCARIVVMVWQGEYLYRSKSDFGANKLVQNGANAPHTR